MLSDARTAIDVNQRTGTSGIKWKRWFSKEQHCQHLENFSNWAFVRIAANRAKTCARGDLTSSCAHLRVPANHAICSAYALSRYSCTFSDASVPALCAPPH
eukprot:2964477-Amphidinium_carterae.1